MTLHLSIDEARKVAQEIEEELAELRRLSGQGDSQGWIFNRDDLYERR